VFKCEVIERLSRIEAKLDQLIREGQTMSAEIDALAAQVEKNTELEASAVTLIEGLAARIEAAQDDPVRLRALTDELRQKADVLATAITTNTPPAPPTS
jgi:outer membrane murein-binding lipoprotein Lpp